MRNLLKNSDNGANRVIAHLAIEKKKVILVACLIIMMLFMWIKVFMRKSPNSVDASEMLTQSQDDFIPKNELNISLIELPEIKGRHDLITRDFFASEGWMSFISADKKVVILKEVDIDPGESNEKVINRIADNMKLEAFVMGENPRAYINDHIVSIGDILLVSDGNENYECEVIMIENNSVVMRCGNSQVKLKLKQINENSK